VARAAGLQPLLWSRWGRDWRRFTTPERIAARATRELAAGDVILLHDADFYSARGSHRRTVQALPAIISELRRRGLDTVLAV
jgi:peptidoglycan/xylan/chitin deacetylase (PgdA/CDA1 family)